MKLKIKAKILLELFVMSGLISQFGNCSPVSAVITKKGQCSSAFASSQWQTTSPFPVSQYGDVQPSVRVPGVCPSTIAYFDSIITATYENKYHNVQEYFNYVDSQGKPRIMLIGGEHIDVSRDRNMNTDSRYRRVGGAENYFFVNLIPHSKPDFTCDAARDEILQLGIEQWDGVIFEHCNIKLDNGKAAQNAFKLLKPGGRILSYSVFEEDGCSVLEFFEKYIPNPEEHWLRKLGIPTELATVAPETQRRGTLWNPLCEEVDPDSDTMIVITKKLANQP